MAYSSNGVEPTPRVDPQGGVVTLSGHLAQDKVLYGGDGTVNLSLTMHADDVLDLDRGDRRHVDLVVVLDRSGSMSGQKIKDAKEAVLDLLSHLSSKDRLALVSYANDVRRHANLLKVTGTNRMLLKSAVHGIWASGGTNLGAGLQEGIKILSESQRHGNVAKVILISDGLANRGITDPAALGHMASIAVVKRFTVATVGVGDDFNEQLMTAIADRGAGSYYYLEDPSIFATVFQDAFHNTNAVVATAVEARIPLKNGLSIIDAAGYPVEIKNNLAIFRPGDLLSGQKRKLFLTLRVPTDEEGPFEIGGVNLRYRYKDQPHTVTLSKPLHLACVKDQQDVLASINKNEWEEKVLQNDYSKLKEEVAGDIKKGDKEAALARIKAYGGFQQNTNIMVRSDQVTENLEKDLPDLRGFVEETFKGAPGAVAQKRKKNAKALQYEGYRGRRNKK